MGKLEVLHLDDDITVLERFAKVLTNQLKSSHVHCAVTSCDDIAAFKKSLQKSFDVVLIDVHLEDQEETGVDLARLTREFMPNAVVMMVSSTRDSKIIRDCLRAGADDFVSKDAEAAEVITRIESSLEGRLISETSDIDSGRSLTVAGATLAAIKARVPAILNSAINCVYVEGESGAGKEVVANLFAAQLPVNVPFIRVNCGAITPTLLMSELFGHVRGSFTGANTDKSGLLESANGGWIFLDEVATLPVDAQISLLRAIDNQAIRRVGANQEKPMSFRVISATNEPLEEMVKAGKFRKDLWQRLRETHISIPPLRERKQEIPDLIKLFLSSMRGGPYQLAPTVADTLMAYDWAEGNVRELRNVLRAMTEKSVGGLLTPKSIPERIWEGLDKKPLKDRRAADRTDYVMPFEVRLRWNGAQPEFERLTHMLFLELLKREFVKSGPMSLRSLGAALGVAKSSVSTKLRALVDENLVTQSELNAMLKSSTKDDDR
jgi:DNA-binding NtrC family response regulator